jgi:hypothetical protein
VVVPVFTCRGNREAGSLLEHVGIQPQKKISKEQGLALSRF